MRWWRFAVNTHLVAASFARPFGLHDHFDKPVLCPCAPSGQFSPLFIVSTSGRAIAEGDQGSQIPRSSL